MVNPESPDQWWARANEKRRAAELLQEGGAAPREIWMLCGEALEYQLKGLIMRKRGLNRWPDPDKSTRQLYSHDLFALADLAEIELDGLAGALRTNWSVVLRWTRAADYDPEAMPRTEADDMFVAAFSRPDGVFTWLTTL